MGRHPCAAILRAACQADQCRETSAQSETARDRPRAQAKLIAARSSGVRLPILHTGTIPDMETPEAPKATSPPPPARREEAVAAAPPPPRESQPPPDAGEPMGATDGRPAMLGKRFRITLVSGMLAGLVLALVGHEALSFSWLGNKQSGWSWFITAIGGLAVGGALTLFGYGVSTDRTDTGPKRRGQADVTTEGEWSRTKRRRRVRRRRNPRA